MSLLPRMHTTAQGASQEIASSTHRASISAIVDDFVLWSAQDASGKTTTYALNRDTGESFTFPTSTTATTSGGLTGSIVPITLPDPSNPTRISDLLAEDLQTREVVEVAKNERPGAEVVVSGTWIAYWGTDDALYVRNLGTMADPIELAHPAAYGSGMRISGDWVVWYDVDGANSEGQERWQLKAMRIGNANARIMDEGWGTGSGATIVGHTVIFQPLTPSSAQSQPLGGDVVAVDLETGTKSTYREPAGCFQPHWNDDRYAVGTCIPVQGATNQAWGLDLANGSVFSIPLFNQTGINPPEFVYDSGKFGWTEHRADGWHVLLTPVGSALPSSSKPNPGTTNPDWLYFTETSHYLSFGFKTFWLKSGGLPVFGFPLTEEFSELNPDQGKMLTVQYMERQRFEYHAEFAGTPYEVELGRLGAEDAAERDLTGAQPFQPAAIPSTAVGDDCPHFAETQHNVCSVFFAYWHSHGLDFGDPGISYRESLALFGYPISEPFKEANSGLLVQYFERAVFEYHPNNPEPYRIELRRLGAEQLAARGW